MNHLPAQPSTSDDASTSPLLANYHPAPDLEKNASHGGALYAALARAIFLATGVFLTLWFLDAITLVALFFIAAFILAVALNPPVAWLEARRVPRPAGTLLVLISMLGVAALVGWMVVPRLVSEATSIAADVPEYLLLLERRGQSLLDDNPQIAEQMPSNGRLAQQLWPTLQTALVRVGRYSITAVAALVFALLLLSTVGYALAKPRPLLRGMLVALPLPARERTECAFIRGSRAVSGWLMGQVIVGTVEAIAATVVLSMLGVPGAFVWGALTFFAELVPQLGSFLMAAPPVLVALAVDPPTALWVLLFYLALQQLAGTFLVPVVQGRQMDLHPVSLLFAVLALGSVFGILGALIATPVAGIVKAFYDEFYASRQPVDEQLDERVEAMLHRRPSSEK